MRYGAFFLAFSRPIFYNRPVMSALLDYRYWLNTNPVPLGSSLVGAIFIFFAWFVIAGVAFAIAAGALKKRSDMLVRTFGRLAWVFIVTGLLGLLLLFFAYEQLPILGMRLWLLPLVAYFFVKLGYIARFIVRDYPRERDRAMERARLDAYMPRRRRA